MDRKQPTWYLEGLVSGRTGIWRTEISPFPFRVGRMASVGLQLRAPGISNHHAEISKQGESLVLKDLGSTNGTFVNLDRVESATPLNQGDVVHFADQEFRVVVSRGDSGGSATEGLNMELVRAARAAVARRPEFEAMIKEGAFDCMFQPIVTVGETQRVGFEVLGRGSDSRFPTSPVDLLGAAEQVGLELELSRAFRLRGCEYARTLPNGLLFLNTHPHETGRPKDLIESLRKLCSIVPGMQLVLEIHEEALTDIEAFAPIRKELGDMGIEIAFDDFGKGQSRLLELAELEPTYLKFDRMMIAELDKASPNRRDMIRTIVNMVGEMGIRSLAEGVETEGEATSCREVGFQFAQGHLFGRPARIEEWQES